MEFLIITGMSGAGKSVALNFLKIWVISVLIIYHLPL